ncbi:MAG: hypothetical protein AB4911_25360, partial [Oscillochloridaceae bacterium umkhey_bin13]
MIPHKVRFVGLLLGWNMVIVMGLGFLGSAMPTRAAPIMQPKMQPEAVTIRLGPDGMEVRYAETVSQVGQAGNLAQACNLPPPTLVAPIEGIVSRDLRTPLYTFEPIAETREYIYQVATNSNFTNPLTTDRAFASAGETTTVFASFFDLNPLTTYFWRMSSVCSDGTLGAFSEPATFRTGERVTGATCDLPPPTLLSPAMGATVETLVPIMSWENSSQAYEHRYQLARYPNFTLLESSGTYIGLRPANPTPLTAEPRNNLQPNTLYYWRVASNCAEIDTIGAFGPARTFMVGDVTGPFPVPPVQLAPASEAVVGSVRVTFLLQASEGATNYRIYFYRSLSNAMDENWSRATTTGGTQASSVFNPNETWYWRVMARNDKGWGALSNIRSFRTPLAEANATVTPEGGGTLVPNPGFLSLTFPPGAVSAPTNVRFDLLTSPSQPLPNLRFANRAFTIKAFAGETPVTNFAQPFTMTLTYDEADLIAAGISDPSQLNLTFWDGSTWVPILP